MGYKLKAKMVALIVPMVMAVSLLFTSCGSSSNQGTSASSSASYDKSTSPSYDGSATGGNYSQVMPESGTVMDTANGSDALTAVNRKLIKNASFRIESKDYSTSVATLEEIITTTNGYIESSSSYGNIDAGEATSSYTIRVPITEYASFKQAVSAVGNIYESSEGSEDVTAQYFDTEARLTSLRAHEKRLLELMAEASSMANLITIEEKLSTVRYEIETLTTSLRKYDNLVEYTTIDVRLQQTANYTPAKSNSFFDRVGEAFSGSFKSMVLLIQDFFIGAIWMLPYALIAGVIVLIIVLISRATAKKRKHTSSTTFLPNGYSMSPPNGYNNTSQENKPHSDNKK